MDLQHDTETIEDLSALAWVHDELRRSLEMAHKSMRRYLKEADAVAGSDVDAVDPTYSVAKSLLATVAGVAVRDGLLPDLDETVGKRVHDGGYDSEHNAPITWRQSLQQTSEWEGTLWGKPDTADRREGRDREEVRCGHKRTPR